MISEQIYQDLYQLRHWPVEQWQPSSERDIGLRIDRRGDWWQDDQPVRNARVRALFCRLLSKQGNDYWLVTPTEKFKVQCSALPLRWVDVTLAPLSVQLADGRTQTVHPDDIRPYCQITGEDGLLVVLPGGVEAQASRQLFYRLVEQSQQVDQYLTLGPLTIAYILG